MDTETTEGKDVASPASPDLAATGIEGLDTILGGGLPRGHTYLVQGRHGSGKTTLALQFCMAGAQRGERVLYLSTCESEREIRQVACSHGWSLEGVDLHFHDPGASLPHLGEQSVFRPSEIELPRTMDALREVIESIEPQCLVIDALSEIRLLSPGSRWFRHQVLALRETLARRKCTTILCDEQPAPNQPVNSIVHGILDLKQLTPDYGPDRRRLRVAKLRGQSYASGYHDFKILSGGLQVFPRLVAAEHRGGPEAEILPSGIPALDTLFGGGIDRGTSLLLLGPSGTGKSSVATRVAVAAGERGEHVVMYVFDERVQTLMDRARTLDLGLEAQLDRGTVELRQVDPAELTPGEFTHSVRQTLAETGLRLLVIDSLAGYVHAMPDERNLVLHLHELLSLLNQGGVTVLMVMTQHGLPGTPRHIPFDLSYIADSVLMFHSFEFRGELRKAVSVYKRRMGPHEPTLRELELGPTGIRIGEPLREFHGITSGVPQYAGESLADDERRNGE